MSDPIHRQEVMAMSQGLWSSSNKQVSVSRNGWLRSPSLGSWGSFVFEVRGDLNRTIVRTYSDYTRATESRWGVHEVMNTKPKPQYGGPGQDEISIVIRLSADLGVNPKQEADRLRAAAEQGVVAPFIRNGRPESQGNWYIESLEETDLHVSRRGVDFCELNVTFKEYF